jgi:hypothetical protein
MSGANLPAIQRILRRGDPQITTEFYGHLSPDHLWTISINSVRARGRPNC